MARAACSSDPQVALDFAKVAVRTIVSGEDSSRRFTAAAKRLNTNPDDVRREVSLLSRALDRAARLNVSHDRMVAFLSRLGYQDHVCDKLASFFSEQLPSIRSVLVPLPLVTAPVFKSLKWRLDVQIASRRSHNQAQPSFLLKLTTSCPSFLQGTGHLSPPLENTHYLQADYKVLKEICVQLEEALKDSRSSQTCRILGQLKD